MRNFRTEHGARILVAQGVRANSDFPLVMHVEDNEGDARMVVRSLAHSPCRVRIERVVSAPEAVAAIDAISSEIQEMPSLILLDLGLPGGHGLDVLRAVKSSDSVRAVPIVILTGSDAEEDRNACKEAGCEEFIVKPMEYTELVRTMSLLCERHIPAYQTATV